MKIVCDACSAKYSIADEKVRGKVFKIRCKKCSNIIVVRGASEDAGDEAPAQPPVDNKETKVFDYAGYDSPEAAMAAAASSEAIWHVVIDQEQVGPLTADEVRARLSAGEIDADSYIWREGFSDWQRLAEVSDFSDVGAEDGSAGMFGGPPVDDGGAAQEDPADLFAAAGGGGGGGDLFGGSAGMAAADDGGGLFGSASGGGAAAAAGGPVVVESQLRGQRNENSVLFSLNNLASLASDAPKAAAPAASAPAASSGPGMAEVGGTEGSGLIDIRSMAQVYLGDSGGPAAASAPKTGSADDLPVFSQASFQAASPVLLPTQSSSANNKLIYGLIGAIAFLVVAATILIVVVLSGGDDEPAGTQLAQAGVTGETADDEEAAAETPDEEAEAAEEAADEPPTPPSPSEAAAAAAAEKKEEPAAKKEEERRASRDRNRDRRRRSGSTKREREEPKKEPVRRDPVAEATSGGCDEVACLVEPDKACCKKYRKRRSSGGSGGSSSNLPETLTRSDISKGIGRVRGQVTSCGEKHGGSGTVKVKIKIGGNGRVSSAQASGGGSSLRSCVVSAVKRARFPKTQRGMTVTYPFVFR